MRDGIEISEIRVSLAKPEDNHRLLARVSVTFGGAFVVHELKVVQKDSGELLLQMPNRQLADFCKQCKAKNELRANYCKQCGTELGQRTFPIKRNDGRPHSQIDTAHCVNNEYRLKLTDLVLRAYHEELQRCTSTRPLPTSPPPCQPSSAS